MRPNITTPRITVADAQKLIHSYIKNKFRITKLNNTKAHFALMATLDRSQNFFMILAQPFALDRGLSLVPRVRPTPARVNNNKIEPCLRMVDGNLRPLSSLQHLDYKNLGFVVKSSYKPEVLEGKLRYCVAMFPQLFHSVSLRDWKYEQRQISSAGNAPTAAAKTQNSPSLD